MCVCKSRESLPETLREASLGRFVLQFRTLPLSNKFSNVFLCYHILFQFFLQSYSNQFTFQPVFVYLWWACRGLPSARPTTIVFFYIFLLPAYIFHLISILHISAQRNGLEDRFWIPQYCMFDKNITNELLLTSVIGKRNHHYNTLRFFCFSLHVIIMFP